MPAHNRTIKGVSLLLTCHAYPEQYSVYIGDKMVAEFYLRLGIFLALDSDFNTFFEYFTIRDEFDNDGERTHVLTRAVDALLSIHTPPIISMF